MRLLAPADYSLFQKAGLVWGGVEDGGEESEVGGGQTGLVGLGGLHHWMNLMTEHVAQDSSRLPFLWPGLSTGNTPPQRPTSTIQ